LDFNGGLGSEGEETTLFRPSMIDAPHSTYHRKPHEDALRSFAKRLMQTKPFKLVAVALANGAHRLRDHARQDKL